MAEIGDRFTIEIENVFKNEDGKLLYKIKGFNSLVFDEAGIERLKKCDRIKERKIAHDAGYDHGLREAWAAAGKIECDIPIKDIYGLFGYDMPGDIFRYVDPGQAVCKIRKYEERIASEKQQLNVGDVVMHKQTGERGVVFHVREDEPLHPGEPPRHIIHIITADNIYVASSPERKHDDFVKVSEGSKELLALIKFLNKPAPPNPFI